MVNDNGEIDASGENYLSADAELVEVPQLVTEASGNTIYVDGNGNLTLDPAGNRYLLADTPTLTADEYQAAKDAGEPDSSFTSYTDADGTGRFIRKSDLVTMSQEQYQEIQDSAMVNSDDQQPYVLTKNGKDYYIVKRDESVIYKSDYEAAATNLEKLEYLANEKRFVDIGLGFQENDQGKLIESTAFNEALNGLTFLGYGLDEDGDPKNIYSIVQRLTDLADSVPDGEDWSDETYNEFYRLVGKLEDASSEFKTQFANMDAGTLKLENNLSLLEENFYNLDEQTSNLEDIEPVEAIENLLWAEYAYNAALKVGNSILSQSLMDYLQ